MTKNEFRDKLLEKIDDFIEAENATNTKLKHHYINTELWCSVSQCENYIIEASCVKHKIMKIVSDYFSDNAIETDSTPYEEMWEELKEKISDRGEENFLRMRQMAENKQYHNASYYEIRHQEDEYILADIEATERKRGIWQ